WFAFAAYRFLINRNVVTVRFECEVKDVAKEWNGARGLCTKSRIGNDNPLLVRRGGCGIKRKSAKPSLAPQTGWWLTSCVERAHSETWLVVHHPVHPSSRGGECTRDRLFVQSRLEWENSPVEGHSTTRQRTAGDLS